MSTVRLRPTFRLRLASPRDAAIEAVRRGLRSDERFAGRWRGKGRWAEIHVPHAERKVWSPHLSLRLDDGPGEGCTLFGRFAPPPEVWTFFMFLYVGLVFGVVFGAVLGYVQWASGEQAWGLWALVIGLPAIGLIHVAGAVGQRLGQAQMQGLMNELDELLSDLGPELLPD